LLVRLITPLPDAGLRFAAIRAFGEAAYMNAASLRPVQSDSWGELYLVGPEPNPLAFVRVCDASPGPDGVHQEYWLSVPPHMATAREAVAWTFGMSESAYSPAAQS
jgi:hypothetical protein